MRGHENLIRMRLNGLKPSIVWVELLPMNDWVRQFTDRPGRFVDIHMDPQDTASIERADLRCVVGCHVLVNGPNDDTTERVASACKRAGANVVEAFFFDLSKPTPKSIVKAMHFSAQGVRTVWPQ
jgi:hypothetical protein